MTAPEPTPTVEHIDAVARVIESAWSDGDDAKIAHRILTSTDPAVHAAMLDALVRAGVLTPEDAPIARHGGYEHTHWQQRWDGQHTHEGRRFVTSWEVAP
jgi:hypothetical protein